MNSFFQSVDQTGFLFENFLDTPNLSAEDHTMGNQEKPASNPWRPWTTKLLPDSTSSIVPRPPWSPRMDNLECDLRTHPLAVIRSCMLTPSPEASQFRKPMEQPQKRTSTHLVTNFDYRLYGQECGWNRVGEESRFYVEARKGVPKGQPREFRLRLVKKDGTYLPLKLVVDTIYRGRYVCIINPPAAGDYILAATYNVQGQHLDIRGSPQSFHVFPPESRSGVNRSHVLPIGFRPAISASPIGKVLGKPWGLTVHRRENYIYVTDRLQHCILVFNVSGEIVRKFGSFGTQAGQLYRPSGIAIDETKNRVIVADKDNHRIAVFTTDGKFLETFGSKGFASGGMNYPWGVSVSSDGTKVVVADSRNHRIQLFHGETYTYINKFSIFESNPYEYKCSFDYPRDVLFDSTGDFIFVSDFNIHAVLKIDAECNDKSTFSPLKLLNRPQGMAWDEDGNLLVADSTHRSIRIFSSTGKYLRDVFTGRVRLLSPTNVAILRGGKIAIIDGGSNTLHII